MVLVSINARRNGKVKEKRKENGVHLVTHHLVCATTPVLPLMHTGE